MFVFFRGVLLKMMFDQKEHVEALFLVPFEIFEYPFEHALIMSLQTPPTRHIVFFDHKTFQGKVPEN